jgi:hypothetical protein
VNILRKLVSKVTIFATALFIGLSVFFASPTVPNTTADAHDGGAYHQDYHYEWRYTGNYYWNQYEQAYMCEYHLVRVWRSGYEEGLRYVWERCN